MDVENGLVTVFPVEKSVARVCVHVSALNAGFFVSGSFAVKAELSVARAVFSATDQVCDPVTVGPSLMSVRRTSIVCVLLCLPVFEPPMPSSSTLTCSVNFSPLTAS